jgi:DNA repair exonuclease SbcCD ATPase subunit/DNA repair exonuclease SbcCD nuclease subunit
LYLEAPLKFAHISDTHIKNLKYHYEYRIVFDQLYQSLREQEVDYIVHCGDIAHTKTQISPEFVEMCSDFFRSLAEIAPTYIILGNHDGNLKNSSRQDALTPIVDALNLPRLHLLKDSGETHLNDDFCLNVLSVFDRDNWVKPSNTDKINIALYHGSISRCQTDTNWTMSFGEDEITIFDDFDFAMLGDIHRRQFLDKAGRIWYAGSTVQQNHGETNDKGILIWNIKSKDDWDIEPVVLQNPKPFFTIPLTLRGRMPRNIEVPQSARLRLVSTNNLPLNVMKRAMDIAKSRFNPESISFLNRASGERGNVEEITDGLKTENLRDPKIQEELISEYLKDHQVPSHTMEKVYELNRTYNKIIEEKEEVSRNVNWKLSKFQFDNLFNYGEDNVVNFNSLNGIIGIFGKNFSGKSSIIDAALYTLFNTTSKNERKNLNVINQNREIGKGTLTIESNNKTYTIERESKKYVKRLKGEETMEAKTDLNFEVYDPVTDETTSLNGTTRNQTDANIRKHFGTIDDFMVSSLASQHGALAFIDEGSTRRKEIIAKFLDLEIFEKKFKMVKENSIEAKVLIKKHQNRDYDQEVKDASLVLEQQAQKSENNKVACESLKNSIEATKTSLSLVDEQISAIPAELIDIRNVREQQKSKSRMLVSLASTISEQNSLVRLKQIKIDTLGKILDSVDLESLLKDKSSIEKINQNIILLNRNINDADKKIKMLKDHKYDPDCVFCCENTFVKDAHMAAENRKNNDGVLKNEQAQLVALKPKQVKGNLTRYESVASEMGVTERELSEVKLNRERNKNSLTRTELELKEITELIKQYDENKDAIENLEELMSMRTSFNEQITSLSGELESCEADTLEVVKMIGSYEQKVESLQEQKKEYIDLQNSYAAYDLFMQAMHPNGIAYDVIKKKIPVINQEIAKVLANIVEFEIFFESSGNKFDIFIKHPLYDERPIEMASGAEKTMAAMAIRLALLSVSSLPKSDVFILDEPGTALDEENMEGFIRILELIKVYFKNVLLISHLDSLKDCVDMQIVIEKKAGYARVNQ